MGQIEHPGHQGRGAIGLTSFSRIATRARLVGREIELTTGAPGSHARGSLNEISDRPSSGR
jgi:hypothetical protein